MRALPRALSIDAASQGEALELLEQAMEPAPADALPIALAAWCHGQRGGHHFTTWSIAEKKAARELAGRAAQLNTGDPVATALLASAYTLAHDLPAAGFHFDRALALDGACVWAWNRSGWVSVYHRETADAIDRFQIALSIAPDDPLNFFCSIGIAAAHFEAGRYDEAARWFTRGLAEHPSAVWANRFRAPAYALAGRKAEARRSVAELLCCYPDLTITDVRSALPHTPSFFDRAAEGLEAAGLRPQLDFPHFPGSDAHVMTQNISSAAMNCSASSIDRMVRPKGPAEAHRSFQSDQYKTSNRPSCGVGRRRATGAPESAS